MNMRWLSMFCIILISTLGLTACDQSRSAEEYIQNGQDFYNKKEWKSAIIEFKNAVKQAPDNATARARLGQTYLKTFSPSAAIKELNRAIELGYNKTELLIPLGSAYRQSNEFARIIEDIDVDSNQSSNEQAQILALRAIAYLGTNQTDEALVALNKAKQLDDTATEVRLAWATFERGRGNISEQKAWLMPLLERDGGIADAWSQMAQIETIEKNLEAAEKAYTRSIELRQVVHLDYARRAFIRVEAKDLTGAQSDIDALKKAGANWPIVGHIDGVIAFHEKNFEAAQAKFQAVLSRASEFAPSQYMMAMIHFNNKNYANAVTLLERYISVNPDQVKPNFIYASSLLQLNQIDKAMEVLNGLKAKNPEDYRVLTLLGNGYLRQGQTDKAIVVLKQAVALKPDQARSRLQLGSTLLADDSTRAKGQQELITAIELDPNLLQAEIILFRSYLGERRFADARALALNLEQKNPDDSQGANLVALTYLAEQDREKGLAKLNETLKQFPGDFPTLHNLARTHLQGGELATAKSLYETAVEKEPSNLQALNQLALIAAREQDKGQMMERLRQAQERNPDEIAPRIALASQYLRQKENSRAITVLNGAKPEQKNAPGHILLMATAKIAVGEKQHASRLLRGLVASNPNIPAAYFLQARIYALDEKKDDMRSALQKTIELQPEHFAANIIMARLDLLEGNVDAFKTRVAFLDKTFPDNPQVQFFKAKLDSGDSNYGGAIETLSSLMAQSPNTEIIIDLSKNQWQQGDKQGAIAGLQLWIEENAEDTRAMLLLAQFYLSENQTTEAIATYEKLNKLSDDNSVVLNNLAWLLGESNPQQGIEYALKALSLAPDNAFAQDTLAMLYFKTSQFDKALEYSTKAAEALPRLAEVQFNYATILAANGQDEKARDWLNNMLSNATNEDEKKMIREQLDAL